MNNFVNELIEKADIVDIIGRFVSLHKSGANFFGLCPFHPDQNPSMSVSPKKKIFRCFSCGASGNVINFIQKFKKISYGEAIKEVALMSGYSDKDITNYLFKQNKNYSPLHMRLFDLNADANELFKTLLYNNDNKQYLEYLYKRKLSDKTIKQFEIGFSGKGNIKRVIYDLLTDQTINHKQVWNEDDLLKASLITINNESEISDYFHNRITFPIKDKNGFIVAFIARDISEKTELKYLTSRDTTIFHKSTTLYNFDRVTLNQPNTLIVLEGNVDLMSLYESGMNEAEYGAIALMGTAFTSDHKQMIASTQCIQNIILWFDNDNAGIASTLKNGIQLLPLHKNMIVVQNPTKYKDVNEILVNEGKNKVLEILQNEDNPRFVSYYIQQKLNDITSLNLDAKVRDVLKIIKLENNLVYTESYLQIIANITKLNINDLRQTLSSIKVNNYMSIAQTPNTQVRVINSPIINNLINSLRKLITLLLINPTLSEKSYIELECKNTNNNFIHIINDYLFIIKTLATTTFLPTDLLNQENKLFDLLFTNHQINSSTYKFIKDVILEIQTNYSYSIHMKSSEDKCASIVNHINLCYYQFLVDLTKYNIAHKNLNNQQLQNEKENLVHYNSKVSAYKKNKKSKFSIN